MIVQMLKYAFVLHHNDLEPFLAQLQKLGVVDVERHDAQLDDKANELFLQSERYMAAYRQLKLVKVDKDSSLQPYKGTPGEILAAYEASVAERERLTNKVKRLEKDIQDALPWGNFEPDFLDKIAGLGLTSHFYVVFEKSYNEEWEQKHAISIINKANNKVYFVLLQHKGETLDFDQQEIKFPTASYSVLTEELAASQQQLDEVENIIKQLALSAEELKQERTNLMNAFDFQVAQLNAKRKAEGTVAIVTGWIPKEQNENLVAFLENQGTVYLSEEPKKDDNPPILLKNNRFAKLFEVITNLYSLPNYNEIDPTPFFAPFFMLFFGLCFGDGGYGILILIVTSLLKLKIKGDARSLLSLAQWFGAATVFVSLFTGTIFGITVAPLNILGSKGIIEQRYKLDDNYAMLYLSIIIGAIQVLFGMSLNAAKVVIQQGIKYALSQIAWVVLIIMIALYLFAGNYLGIGIYAVYALMAVSLLIVFFYNNPDKNVFINFGGGLWNTYNVLAGLLGDLLSYIRLFALGLTGGILGMVFNQLAFSIQLDIPVLGALLIGLVLVIGHSLNFLLSGLGAFVHPLRLTFVEYYKNSGFEGGGKKYNPLKIN